MSNPSSGRKAVVLLSGGLDSATVLAIAQDQGYECYALTVLYGQRHKIELSAAGNLAVDLKAKSHKLVQVELDSIGGSALTDQIAVPKSGLSDEIPVTYVPARNTIFLSIALGYAETLGAFDIFAGMNAVDYSGYPDCRPEFIEAFEQLANLATKAGVDGQTFKIHAPLIHLKKTEIIQEGLRLGVDYSKTHSCYDPIGDRPCERCDSCRIRISAFSDLGMTDPALVVR